MKDILKYKYKMRDHSASNLKLLGFRYNKFFSNKERQYYSIRFPVIKYNSDTNIEGEIIIDAVTGNVILNVYDLKGNPYPPFYNHEYGNYDDLLKIIYRNIQHKMRECKIKKVVSNYD